MNIVDVPLLMATIARTQFAAPTVVCCNQAPENNGDYLLFFTTGEGVGLKNDVQDYYDGTVFLAISNPNYSAGFANAAKAMKLFDFQGKQFDNPFDPLLLVDFKLCRPEQLPVSFARNESGNIEFILSFTVRLSVSENT